MKEININIEGYNVNGICVGCLNYNRKMFYHRDIKQSYRLLGNIDVPDGLEIQLCWECFAAVRKAMRFRDLILKSYEFLIGYSQKTTFLDSPSEFICNATTHLEVTCVQHTDIADSETLGGKCLKTTDELAEVEVKTEEDKEYEVPVKEESLDNVGYPSDDLGEAYPASDVQGDVTSDDDIQLSKLKNKDEGKKTKRKRSKTKIHKEKPPEDSKTSRKLKNLPEDIVKLHTMSEQEMWVVRTEDLASEDFQSLKYKCNDCIMTFNTKQLMQEHVAKRHQPKGDSQLCDVCNAYYLTRDNISTHRSLHLSAYLCSQCGLTTTIKRRMLKHVETHTDERARHVCDICGCVFSTKSKLSYHRSVSHQERPQCDCCGKVFANKMTLKYHLKILPNNPEKPKEKLYIPCKGCEKVFHSKKSYRAHVVIHNGLTYPCPTCGKLFQWKRNLARHARNHRERDAGARHECRACGKTFASRDCYNNHMRMSKKHVTEDAYQHECNYCGKKFATKWCLTDHVDWDHFKRIKYQCTVCFKPFKTAKIMVAHVNNIHEGKKRELVGEHLCEICGKSYRTVKRLKGHVWAMHTNRSTSKSFKCKLCPATFTWQTSIYKHMKMMHDSNKKIKHPRPPAPVKKEENYPEIELANRMFFQPNITNNLNVVHIQPLGVAQNII